MKHFFKTAFVFSLSLITFQALADGLVEISQIPFTITNAGSYIVTSPLTGSTGNSGIEIQVGEVTLDLNGFTLNGVSGSLDGIDVSASIENVDIRNGMVRGWGDNGIDALSASNSHFSKLIVHTNANAGLLTGLNCTVDGVVSFENGGALGPSPVSTNEFGNGMRVENGSVISHCISRRNNGHGLITHSATRVETVVLWRNGHDGLHGSHATSVQGLNCGLNSEGVEVDTGSSIVDSMASQNVEDGFRFKRSSDAFQGGGVVHGSMTYFNGDNGFDLGGSGVRIYGSMAYSNVSHGFRMSSNSVATANLSALTDGGSSGDAFNIADSHVKADQNHAVHNRDGYQFSTNSAGENSILLQNSATGSSSDAFDNPGVHVNHLSEESFPGIGIANEPWTNFEF